MRPVDAALRVNLANVLRERGRLDEAIAAYRRAVDLEPDSVTTRLLLAGALQEAGRAAEALAVVDQALAVDPRSGEAWRVKAELTTFRPGDPDIGAMETLLAATADDLEPGARMRLGFALGKAWMDIPHADRAFAHLDEANRRRRAELNYDVEAAAGWMAAIAETFTPELMRRFAGVGHPSERPVFIVGMPRSGTSLVEQILASHAQVHGAGELDCWRDGRRHPGAQPVRPQLSRARPCCRPTRSPSWAAPMSNAWPPWPRTAPG